MKTLMWPLLGLLLGLQVAGCVAMGPLDVTNVFPLSGETVDPSTASLSVTFSEALDPNSVTNAAITLVATAGAAQGSSVGGTVTYYAPEYQITFLMNPATPLQANTTYEATVKTSVVSAGGVPMSQPYSWTFSTGTPK